MSSKPRRRRIDMIRDPDFLRDLDEIGLDELRARRLMCDELENELSYYRRLLHGRMDLLDFELRRRRGDESRSIIEALPEILTAGEAPGQGRGGRVMQALLPDLPDERRRHIDRVLRDDFLARIGSIESEQLIAIQSELSDAEREVSAQRQSVQRASDAIHQAIADRYKGRRLDELLEPS